MAYSEKSFRVARRGAYASMFAGIALLVLLVKLHAIDRALYMCLACALAVVASLVLMHTHRYRDEIQRHAAEKRGYWGYQFGILASVPVLVVLMLPNTPWLDEVVQFVSRNHAAPRQYFWFGFMLPVLCQTVAVLYLRLLANMRDGGQE